MSWFGKLFKKSDEQQASSPAAAADVDEKVTPDEADEVLPEDNRSLLLQLISKSSLSIGMDLSKVALPTFILEPRSLLEKLGDIVVHPEILSAVPQQTTPEARMVEVVRWYLSAYHVKPKGTKKPFNPVLGETFAATYTASPQTGCTDDIMWTAQQVSHHPPVSAFFARDVKGSVVIQGCFAPKSKFLGNSAASIGGGTFRVYLPELGEVYYCNWPSVYVRGVLFGTLLMEICGTVCIACPETNITAVVEFEAKKFFGGTHHHVSGSIFRGEGIKDQKKGEPLYVIDGYWVGKTTIKPAGSAKGTVGEVLFDATVQPLASCAVDTTDEAINFKGPNDERGPSQKLWASRESWRPVAEAILANDQHRATVAKQALEQYQRDLRQARADNGDEFKPTLFELDEQSGEWVYVGPNAIHIPPLGSDV